MQKRFLATAALLAPLWFAPASNAAEATRLSPATVTPTASAETLLAQANWQMVNPPEGRFSVRMPPGKVQKNTETRQTEIGELKIHMHMLLSGATAQRPAALYAVAYNDVPGNASALNDQQINNILQKALTLLAGRRGAKAVKGPTPITLGNAPGLEADYQVPQIGTMRYRVYLVGDRLYQLMVMGQQGVPRDAGTFLNSFQVP